MEKVVIIGDNTSNRDLHEALSKFGECISVQEAKILPYMNTLNDIIIETTVKDLNSMRDFLKNKKRRKR